MLTAALRCTLRRRVPIAVDGEPLWRYGRAYQGAARGDKGARSNAEDSQILPARRRGFHPR